LVSTQYSFAALHISPWAPQANVVPQVAVPPLELLLVEPPLGGPPFAEPPLEELPLEGHAPVSEAIPSLPQANCSPPTHADWPPSSSLLAPFEVTEQEHDEAPSPEPGCEDEPPDEELHADRHARAADERIDAIFFEGTHERRERRGFISSPFLWFSCSRRHRSAGPL
jgi:hypothetical protein